MVNRSGLPQFDVSPNNILNKYLRFEFQEAEDAPNSRYFDVQLLVIDN